jgi:hypothetical protein
VQPGKPPEDLLGTPDAGGTARSLRDRRSLPLRLRLRSVIQQEQPELRMPRHLRGAPAQEPPVHVVNRHMGADEHELAHSGSRLQPLGRYQCTVRRETGELRRNVARSSASFHLW